jgi:hypothetical protein
MERFMKKKKEEEKTARLCRRSMSVAALHCLSCIHMAPARMAKGGIMRGWIFHACAVAPPLRATSLSAWRI